MDQDVVEDALRDVEYLLNNLDDLEGEDAPTIEDILDMDVDGLESAKCRRSGFLGWWAKKRSSLGLF